MALNFPLNPYEGLTYAGDNGVNYTFQEGKWIGTSIVDVVLPDQLVSGDKTLTLNPDGSVQFANYKFPANDGDPDTVLQTDGQGHVDWGIGGAGGPGSTGPTGPAGIAGIQGIQGNPGIAGPIGPTGVQGIQGPAGQQGNQGIAGPIGPTGVQGIQGPQGIQGAQGNQGQIGATGDYGPRGLRGDQGISVTLKGSVTGPAFLPTGGQSAGDAWIDQTEGNLYFWNSSASTWDNIGKIVGPQGDVGEPGPRGQQGDLGPTGPQGIQGPQGNPGAKGDQGNIGPTGIQGTTGAQGVQGAKGDQGIQGPTGAQGVSGPQGDTGPAGNTTWNYRASWTGSEGYVRYDVVKHNSYLWYNNGTLDNYMGAIPGGTDGVWDLVVGGSSGGSGGNTSGGILDGNGGGDAVSGSTGSWYFSALTFFPSYLTNLDDAVFGVGTDFTGNTHASNLTVIANSAEWKFTHFGTLEFPSGNMTMGDLNGAHGIFGSDNAQVGILSQGLSGASALQWIDNTEEPTAIAGVVVNSLFANTGDVQIVTGNINLGSPEHSWTFGADGTTTFPQNKIDAGNNYVIIRSTEYAELEYRNPNPPYAADTVIDAYVGVDESGPYIVNVAKNSDDTDVNIAVWTVDKSGNLVTDIMHEFANNTIGDITDTDGNSLIRAAVSTTAPGNWAKEGHQWYNTEDGRTYIRYANLWVDANPLVIPAVSTYLDGLVIENRTISSADYVDTSVMIGGNLEPDGDLLYNLGSPDRQWNHLYVNSHTIYMGGKAVSITDQGLVIDGETAVYDIDGGSAATWLTA